MRNSKKHIVKQLAIAAALIGITTLGFAASGSESASGAGKPKEPQYNIVFIIADDLGIRDLGITGSTFYETPNIDRLARNGMLFTDGYSASPICTPARASILTGQSPDRHGLTDWIGSRTGWDWWSVPEDVDNAAWREYRRNPDAGWQVPKMGARERMENHAMLAPEFPQELRHSHTTIAEALKEAGYVTHYSGKWHLGFKPEDRPEEHGFDTNKGGHGAGMPSNFFSPYKNPALEDGPDGEMLDIRLAEETAKFIENHKNERFFAFLSLYSPHTPVQCSREKWEKYRAKAAKLGPLDRERHGSDEGFINRQVQDDPVYAGLIEHMDDAVGVVLAKLKELGLDKNTVVVFTSDNGGVSISSKYPFTSTLPFRGGKGQHYEGGVRVPFIVSAPGITKTGSTCATPVSGVDFYPTFLEIAGAPLKPEQHADGISLLPLLEGGVGDPDRALFWHYPHNHGAYSWRPASWIRSGNWKLVYSWNDGTEELFDLSKDIGERNNLVQVEKAKASELRDKLFERLMETKARVPSPNPFWNPEKTAALWKSTYAERKQVSEEIAREMLNPDWEPSGRKGWGPWWGSGRNNEQQK
jgi:arylsulfatase A-like enzyme